MEQQTRWRLKFSKRALKDWALLKDKKLDEKTEELLKIIRVDPYRTPPSFEKLLGLENTYSRRINNTHRLVYRINKEQKQIEVISMFRHYQ